MANELIQCDDHGMAPWHLMCRHLVAGLPVTRWCSVPLDPDDRREIDCDWVCDKCTDKVIADSGREPEAINLPLCVCIHCCNDLKERAGFVRDKAGILVKP